MRGERGTGRLQRVGEQTAGENKKGMETGMKKIEISAKK